MSLNIGTEGCLAAKALQPSPDWKVLRDALEELARSKMNQALDAPPEVQATACGYARALRDLWVAFEAATVGGPGRAGDQNQVRKPGPISKEGK